MDDSSKLPVILGGLGLLAGGAVLYFLIVVPLIGNSRHFTTYCTDYTRVVSITPTNHDKGKFEDEQYIVKFQDGTIAGADQGSIDPYRCTHTVKVPDTQRRPGWKVINEIGNVDWKS